MSSDRDDRDEVFQAQRPRLWGLAYRMLGSGADAEDAVQDTYVRWRMADRDGIDRPAAWLTSVCARRCVDLLRAAHRSRTDYVGPWLPEPLAGTLQDQAGDVAAMELAASLSTAFLVLLERLTPAERAAFLLRELFDYDYREIAEVLDRTPQACRKLVSRANAHVARSRVRHVAPAAEQRRLLNAFLAALRTGEVGELEAMLAADVELWADGGGKSVAVDDVIEGAEQVARFLDAVWRKVWHRLDIAEADINGARGLVLREGATTVGTVSLALTPGAAIAGIYVVRNPDKLETFSLSGDIA